MLAAVHTLTDRRVSPWRSRVGRVGRHFTRHRMVILVVLTLALAFYVWTAYSAAPFTFTSHEGDVYNLQTTALLHGHTYLPLTVPPGLLRLRDPYDPAQNAPYQAAFHDLALKNGHFYAPWGPTPAVTLYLAFRITGLEMPESFAVVLYAFLGLLGAVGLLHLLVRRLLPRTPDWLLVVATIGLALTNAAPFLLRRPAQYEVAISAGYCFEMLGLLAVLIAALRDPPRWRLLALGSLSLGLAVGARPTLAVGGAVAVAVALYLISRGSRPIRVLIPALAPFLVCVVLLAAYNAVRFGSPTEFGQHYQLAGLDDTKKATDQLSYVPPGVFTYLFVPARMALTFPHFFLMTDTEYPFGLPAGYTGTVTGGGAEPTGGLFPTMPITLVLLGLPWLWYRHSRAERDPLMAASFLAALALAVVLLLSWALWGTTQRYEVDFASFALLAAFLVWAILLERKRGQRRRRMVVAGVGIFLTAVGCAVGTAVSFTGYYDTLRVEHPGLFSTLEDVTSPFATLATMVADKPVLVRVDDGAIPVDLPSLGYGNYGERGASTWLGSGAVTVTVLSPGAERIGLQALAARGPGAPGGGDLEIEVQSPGERPIAVPLRAGYLRLPVHLHWGLNRVKLRIGGQQSSPYEVRLANLSLIP
jgi:hypothetical protein